MTDGETVDVDEDLCDRRTKPREMSYCLVACRGHCVVSLWSEWSDCSEVDQLQPVNIYSPKIIYARIEYL